MGWLVPNQIFHQADLLLKHVNELFAEMLPPLGLRVAVLNNLVLKVGDGLLNIEYLVEFTFFDGVLATCGYER